MIYRLGHMNLLKPLSKILFWISAVCVAIVLLFGWKALLYAVGTLVAAILFGLLVGIIIKANEDRDDEIGF